MKKQILTILVAVLSVFSAQAQNYSGIPQNAKEYIAKHFKGYNISHYEKESEILDVEHKVYVTQNSVSFKLDFDKKGNVTDIESLDDKTPLPNSVLPVKITQHAKAKFPNAKITIEPTTALCSFYAEAGGLMIGFEGGYNVENDPEKF